MYKEEKKYLKDNMFDHKAYDLLKEKKCFLAGGSVIGLFTGQEIKDLDIYCRNVEDAIDVATALQNMHHYKPTYADSKSIVLSYDEREVPPVNMITFKYFNSLEEIFDTYDFTACMGGFDFEKEEFGFHERFFKDNMAKRLYYSSGSHYPIGAIVRRMDKYRRKGYKISSKELLKMVLDCFKLDLSTPEKLKEQVSGMYGTSIDDILPKGEEFSLPAVVKALDNINDVVVSHDSFPGKPQEEVNFTKAFEKELSLVKLKNTILYKSKTGRLVFAAKDIELTEEEEKALSVVEFPIKAYKYVHRDKKTSKLTSFYDKTYEYKVGKYQVPAEGGPTHSHRGLSGIWGYINGQTDSMKYANRAGAVRIEMEIEKEEDILTLDNSSGSFSKVKVVSVEGPKQVPNVCIDPMGEYNNY